MNKRSKAGARRFELAGKLEALIALAYRVLNQTRKRVFDGEALPASEKLVSLREPHTDLIVKGPRPTEYGHKLFLANGRSGIILDCYVGDGNPADSRQAVPTVQRVTEIMGRPPDEVSFDAGYASKDNIAELGKLSV